MNIDNILSKMEKYINIPSPSGYTHKAIEVIKEDFEQLGLNPKLTNKGALIVSIEGEDNKNQVTISAHVDTLGAMVKEIDNNGKVRYVNIGTFPSSSIEGENCIVITNDDKCIRGSVLFDYASVHIHEFEKTSMKRNNTNMYIRLDEKIKTKEDVYKLGIKVGDFICLDTRFEITESGYIKSRYIDDKFAVAMLLEICRYIKFNNINLKRTVNFYISNYEEIGYGISNEIPKYTKELISIDICPTGEGQMSDEEKVTIVAKDNLTLYDIDLKKELIDICITNNIDYEVDIFNVYSSDSSQIVQKGYDIKASCIGPGTNSTHHYERTHINGIKNTANLVLKYITK